MRGELLLHGESLGHYTVNDAVRYVAKEREYKTMQREKLQWDFLQGNEHRGYRFIIPKKVTKYYVKPVDMSMVDWYDFIRATDNLFEVYKQDRSLGVKYE